MKFKSIIFNDVQKIIYVVNHKYILIKSQNIISSKMKLIILIDNIKNKHQNLKNDRIVQNFDQN